MTKRLFVSASIALLLVGGVASARATQNPFDAWRQMFEQPIRHAMRWHPPKYRVHKPMLVKAAPNETPAAVSPAQAPAATDIPDAVLPIPEERPAETPAPPPGPRLRILTDIPDAVLPIPEARPTAPPKTEVMAPLPAQRPAA